MRLSIVILGFVVMLAAALGSSSSILGVILMVAGLIIIAIGVIAPGRTTGSSADQDDQLQTEEEILFVHGEDD